MANTGKPVMIVGVDESEQSFHALEWTLDHFFSNGQEHQFRLIVTHAKPSPSGLLGAHGQGSGDFLPVVERDLNKLAKKTIGSAMEICEQRSVRVTSEILEGDARHALCETVDKHRAAILVVGSHNYGKVKRAFLGSVSDYCAHHAHCTVMIVKKPKQKKTQKTTS
ncbi:hypothetical protein L6164_012537 [Bauhinia variegata]|uniref:Uncharacterized protein n=1 Tax=Bauhinia variegata TaxID=167791 RepID=A0ACB9PFJ0_BAUVA|nr:hypothetical protein L6164_012537 [Bauhinia variegata]